MTDQPKLPSAKTHDPKYFTNPYNFVSWDELKNKPETKALYCRSYAPLDRFYGYSGRIDCRLTTLTPFFVPSGQLEHQKTDKNNHKTKTFLRLPHPETGKPTLAIQATSLKGMVRNVVEAASNSCYAVFKPDEHYSHRPLPQPLPIGIIRQKNAKGDWEMEKLEVARVKLAMVPKEISLLAQVEVFAKVEANQNNSFLKDVTKLELIRPGSSNPPVGFLKGWLKITGEGLVENKRHEKFVYPSSQKKPAIYTISPEVARAYNEVVKEQKERGEKPNGSYFTRLANYELTVGDIVYFKEDTKEDVAPNTVEALGAVAVPRYQYNYKVGKYLPEFLHPCSDNSELCPACRLFGWVRDANEKNKKGEQGNANGAAVAGRVFFSHAHVAPDYDPKAEGNLAYRTLAILSTPKPTTTPFYMINLDKLSDYVDYNRKPDPTYLRGRKFYWHHDPRDSDLTTSKYLQRKKGDRSNLDKQSDQNSTVELLGEKQSVEFTFSVEFENLDKAELGMLLWSLEFDGLEDNNLCHKLGMGKSLGLGSVKVEVTDMELRNRVKSYQPEDLFEREKWTDKYDEAESRKEFTEAFKDYMLKVFEIEFEKLWNIQDLRVILDTQSISNPREIHYPYLPDQRKPELPNEMQPESFRWFVQNNRQLNRRRGTTPYTMPTTTEEVDKPNSRLPLYPKPN